ncbi:MULTISPECIES: metallophosphoesterase family protein [unclassified Pseudomonas]|uniref:metallophosphoesterase family protein n=1 Tax=unclassified Pseudomonas TaxID=196821 RepID=UPI000DAC1BB0|nr:metallophosphoesterase [Pseudomonas sp. URMO17WK12:I6]PZW57624.1 calcineurin-like phosphoesterase family protein [Pseudomonas sp. URMO17WK12:I6]
MNIVKGAKLFACMWILSLASIAHSNEGTPIHMVFASDPQYPWTDKTDSEEYESDKEFEQRAKWLVETQFASIADFRSKMGGQSQVPLMINGDMTAFGHGWQRSYIRSTLQKYFNKDYLYGLGNHDYQNNVDDCFTNSCAAGSIVEYQEHHADKVDNFDLKVTGFLFDKTYSGSLAYSKNIGEVHLVQLNNEPTYATKISHPLNPTTFNITAALDWLENDLRTARVQGYAIIINMHKPYDWQGDWSQESRFRDMIAKYEVTAIFAGHLHENGGSMSYRGNVPVFLSGSASQETYLIASFSADRKQLQVDLVENNQWQNRKPVAKVPVKSIFASRP